MVNLLGRRGPAPAAPRFDAQSMQRLAPRLATLLALEPCGGPARVERAAEALAAELEELDGQPTRIAADSLLEALDAMRGEALATAGQTVPTAVEDGGFVAHRPGRSLSTGEAEIASRGYFDVRDRPPLATWIGVLGATSDRVEGELWIVAWVAPGDVERARAGARACPNGALAWIDEVSAPAEEQLLAAARAAEARRRSG